MASELNLRLLGGLFITQNGAPLGPFLSQKVPALLAYLAVTRRPHTREALAGLLWGDLPEADAKNNLRQALSNLRKLAEPYFSIDRETVEFNSAAPHFLDVAAFEQKTHSEKIEELQAAAALYAGDFLAGVAVRDAPEFEEWALMQKARLRELALHVWQTLTQHHLAHGAYRAAIEAANQLLALDAWREEAHRQLMLALARSGQRSAALAQYETCRRILQKELGVEPSAETQALYQRLRAASHRVHLPSSTTPFVGRTETLTRITQMLATPTGRLITVCGPGGIGKTRLALEAATRNTNIFLHGACFIPLAAVVSLEVVPSTIAEALGLSLSGKTDPSEQLLTHLRDKNLLLVLDNLEHLPQAAEWVGRLAHACPEVHLLITSRERLNLYGERLIELTGLDIPTGLAAKAIADYDAARLFLNSAQNALASFTLSAENEQAVARICRLVSGLPLAIELAAAWVRHLNCAEIADEIERNLHFLATSQKNVPARHQSLQAAFEHSWALLSEAERDAFARLAVFRGGCGREAALAVTNSQLPVLAALCDKSLLHRDGGGRYSLHELLRQYAEGKLRSEPQALAATQTRHSEYYISFLSMREEAQSGARQNEVRREIAIEIDNIRTAWGWAIAQLQPSALEPILESLRIFLEYAGWYAEGVRLFGEAANVEQAQTNAGRPLLGKLLARQAWFYHRLDNFDAARQLIHQSLKIFHTAQPNLPAEEALCLQCLGNMARAVGDFDEAIEYSRQNLARHRRVGQPGPLAASLNTLAVAHAERGEFEEAQQLHMESLTLRRELGDQRGIATALVNLGFIALGRRQYAEVKPLEEEAVEIFREIGYPMGVAVALNNWGVACQMLGEYAEARAILQECLTLCRELGHRHIAAHALGSLGGVAGALGEYQAAWESTRKGLQMAREIGSISATLFGLVSAATLFARQGEKEQAVEVSTLIFHHPAANRETKDRAAQLLAELAEHLPLPTLLAAQERGRAKQLEAVAIATLEFSASQLQKQ